MKLTHDFIERNSWLMIILIVLVGQRYFQRGIATMRAVDAERLERSLAMIVERQLRMNTRTTRLAMPFALASR